MIMNYHLMQYFLIERGDLIPCMSFVTFHDDFERLCKNATIFI